jgi:putative pyruvate formate lyase activating enzyme
VRHLVLPDGLAGTQACMEFLAREISPDTYVNIMGQYRPCGRANEHPALRKFLTGPEHAAALRQAMDAGLTRLDRREKLFRRL